MAIKWKNNERKEFLTMHKSSLKGLLPVLLCAAAVATAMCNAYPFFRERASEKLKTMQQEYEVEQEKDPLFELDDDFKRYLLQRDSVDFTFRGVEYHVDFAGADIFPQGFAAVADQLRNFRGVNMLADIGNGTMNVMYINDRRPQEKKCFTEKYGTHQCMLAVRENLLKLYGSAADETVIDRVLRYGTAEISERYLTAIQATAREYVAGIFRRLREHEYDPELMKLYIVGGGGCLIKNFGEFDAGRVVINEDICATAKGYEYLAHLRARKGGTV